MAYAAGSDLDLDDLVRELREMTTNKLKKVHEGLEEELEDRKKKEEVKACSWTKPPRSIWSNYYK